MKNNLPDIKKEKIFTKFKNWFKSLLGLGKIEEDITPDLTNVSENIIKNEFKESMRVESKDRLLMLQRKLDVGELEVSKLTDKELDEMIEIYTTQINEKEDKIRHYKEKATRDTKEG